MTLGNAMTCHIVIILDYIRSRKHIVKKMYIAAKKAIPIKQAKKVKYRSLKETKRKGAQYKKLIET